MQKDTIITILEFILVCLMLLCWVYVQWGWTDIVSLVVAIFGICILEKIRPRI